MSGRIPYGRQFELLPELLKNSPLVIGTSAFASVYVTSIVLDIPPNESWIIAPFVTFSSYGLNDLAEGEGDSVNQPRRSSLIQSYRWLYWGVVIGAYGVALVLAALSGGYLAFGLTALTVVAGGLYSIPWIPHPNVSRIKELFILNTVYVAATFGVVMTFLPIVFSSKSVSPILAGTIFTFWTLRFSIAIEACNVPDLVGDRQSSVETLPTKFGVKTTQHVLYGGEVLTVGLLLVIDWVTTPPISVLVLLPAIGYSIVCTHLLRQKDCQQALCTASDLHIPLMAVLVFIAGSV